MSRLLALLLLVLLAPAPRAQDAGGDFALGVEAYRRSDHAEARARWQAALAAPLSDVARARVYQNLGNAHWRLGEERAAVACYQAALELDGRNAAARTNLELARARLGLAPERAGGLAGVLARLRGWVPRDAARELVLGLLVLWILALALDLAVGGSRGRAALGLASALVVLGALPWLAWTLAEVPAAPLAVVSSAPATLRAEPLDVREAIGELAPLERVEKLDELPGWVRVERADGLRGWVRSENVYALTLAAADAGG